MEKNIRELEIAVQHANTVQVIHAIDDLINDFTRFTLRQPLAVIHVCGQIPRVAIVEDQVVGILGLHAIGHRDHVGVARSLQNQDLVLDVLELIVAYVVSRQALDSHDLFGGCVDRLVDLGIVPLANPLDEGVGAHLFHFNYR